jgi:hypothetical protein
MRTKPLSAPRAKIDWHTIPTMVSAMESYIADHKEWTKKADTAYLNRDILHPLFDIDYRHYQEWLKENPEPRAPFCGYCGHEHGNSDCYGEYA